MQPKTPETSLPESTPLLESGSREFKDILLEGIRVLPGKGSAFTIYLPPSITSAREILAPDAEGNPAESRGRVLLVEDEETVLFYLATILERDGFVVIKASDAAVALSLAESGAAFDLLITDVVMKGIRGPELCRSLRTKRPGLRTLFISGYTMDENVQTVLGGDTEFLQKPFSAPELLEKIRTLKQRKNA
ncbi:MAG: response regulator [Fibrobacterota bacterium]|nr:response regulator [Fibrobacterota bacterium]